MCRSWRWSSLLVRLHVEQNGNPAIDFVGRVVFPHRLSVAETGHFGNLRRTDAVLKQLAPDRIGPIRRNLPIAVVGANRQIAALGVAREFNGESMIARNLPGQSREDPVAVRRKVSALGFEDRFVRAVKYINEQTF